MYIGSVCLVAALLKDLGVLDKPGAPFNPTVENGLGAKALPHFVVALSKIDKEKCKILEDIDAVTVWDEQLQKVQRAIGISYLSGKCEGVAKRIENKQARAFFRSGCDSKAHAFLMANWARRGCRMSNATFATAIRLVLGLSTLHFEGNKVCTGPDSANTKIVNNSGLHVFSCKLSDSKSQRTTRHSTVVQILNEKLRSIKGRLGVNVIKEPNVVSKMLWEKKAGVQEDNKDRGDIMLSSMTDATEKVLLDVTVRVPSTHTFKKASEEAGLAAEAGWKDKERSYGKRFIVPPKQLVPIAIEVSGRMHPKSREWIEKTARKAFPKGEGTDTYVYFMRDLWERISVALYTSTSVLIAKYDEHSRTLDGPAGEGQQAHDDGDMEDIADDDDHDDGHGEAVLAAAAAS